MREEKEKDEDRQTDRGIMPSEVLLSSAFDLTKKARNSQLGKLIIKDTIDLAPTAYTKIRDKLMEKKVPMVLLETITQTLKILIKIV